MEHYNGGDNYNGVLVLSLRKFKHLCQDLHLVRDESSAAVGSSRGGPSRSNGVSASINSRPSFSSSSSSASPCPLPPRLGGPTVGDVNVAYQSVLVHVTPAFGDRGFKNHLEADVRRLEDLNWQPLSKRRRDHPDVQTANGSGTSSSYNNKNGGSESIGQHPAGPPPSKKDEFVKRKIRGGGGVHSERTMVPCQLRAALAELATLRYQKMITKCLGRNVSHLEEAERRAAEASSFDVLLRNLRPYISSHCLLDSSLRHFRAVSSLLSSPAVIAAFHRELPALTTLHDVYSESERTKKLWDSAAHGGRGHRDTGGVSNLASEASLTYKELVTMLSDLGAIPYFTSSMQVFHLFRHFNRRALQRAQALRGAADDEEPSLSRSSFHLKKDRKGRDVRSLQLEGVAHLPAYEEVERPDFLNFNQFAELLGHVAVAAFAHQRTEDRVVTLWKWFDQSDGLASKQSLQKVRFAIRSGYE